MKTKSALLASVFFSLFVISCGHGPSASANGRPAEPGAHPKGPNTKNARGLTPLMSAAREGDVSAIRELLAQGADPNISDTAVNGWTALMHAIHRGQDAAALALIEAGANVNARANHGTTALIMAAGNGNARVVQALLSSGADPYAEGGGGVTALSMAVSGGALSDIDRPLLGGCYEPVVRLLLEKAPDLTLKHNFAGRSALWFARLKLMMAEDDERGCREVVSLIEKQEQKLAARAR